MYIYIEQSDVKLLSRPKSLFLLAGDRAVVSDMMYIYIISA